MDMETGNNPSGTDSLTEAEAVSKLSGLLAARESEAASVTDEIETSEQTEDTPDEPVEATEEQAETPSDGDDTSTDGEEDAHSEPAEPAIGDDVEIEVNGSKLTLGELKKGHMLHADYTRKTQALKAERDGLETERGQYVNNVRAELTERLGFYEQVVNSFLLPKPSVQMAQDDPAGYQYAQAMWEQQQAGLNALAGERQAQQQALSRSQQELLMQEQTKGFEKLLELHTDLADATPILDRSGKPTYDQKGRAVTKGTQEIASLWQYGVNIFGQELMQQVADPRMFDVLRKAQKQDRNDVTVNKVKQQVASKPALAKPGVSRDVADSSQQERAKAMARLNKSGSVEDAIAALKLASKRK